jgi:hypothetical protein
VGDAAIFRASQLPARLPPERFLCSDLVSSLLRSAASPPFEGMVEAAEIRVT